MTLKSWPELKPSVRLLTDSATQVPPFLFHVDSVDMKILCHTAIQESKTLVWFYNVQEISPPFLIRLLSLFGFMSHTSAVALLSYLKATVLTSHWILNYPMVFHTCLTDSLNYSMNIRKSVHINPKLMSFLFYFCWLVRGAFFSYEFQGTLSSTWRRFC